MSAKEAVRFLIEDHGDKYEGFLMEFADDRPYRSILQRQGKELPEVLELFDWKDDAAEWTGEYGKEQKDMIKLVKNRRKACFCIAGWREFNEDFQRGDVSCLRDIRTPLVTSRSPLMAAEDEFDGE